ncbi:energy-coupled thiamine transporter ThiT [Proteiniclasticum sp. BAD-10]|uniref:Energy-coupled thiamine transporter ThiT n=1 Tax=Proteiniclasticum sediminis TaxID=2804028 RepID=A0A941CQU9_9CLOT|nr:energy-coupled thiamine transporter ThiT [Proteiniclasticum sediminis]MBR0576429.1 energy-coupled thiamine transporter ThiT [Proteiniclasticum sediminis]
MLNLMSSSKEALTALMAQPAALGALIAVFALIVFILVTRKIRLTPLLMAQIAISVAICAVLNSLPLFHMPQGGSVTLASTLPIILMAYAHGPEVGMLTGFLFGVVNLFMGPYIVHPLQTLLDYPLPFMLVGTAGYFKNRFVGSIAGQLLRLIMHVLSGVIFFAAYAPEGQQEGLGLWIYSLGYNGSFVAMELVILLAILLVLPWERFLKILQGSQKR